MALKYVLSETGTGLRRNVSMSVALIVTLFVSLTLVGMGLLLNAQASRTEATWGSMLQIRVDLCNQNSQGPNCDKADATPAQKAAIEQVLKTNPEVDKYRLASKQEAFDLYKKRFIPGNASEQKIFGTVTANDMRESYWVTLKDPQKFAGIESQLSGMQGVDDIGDLHDLLSKIYRILSYMKWGAVGIAGFLLFAAILEVANTIRLAAHARRKEIEIMRLVGASTLYISLPFLLETLLAALIGVAISAGMLAVFMWGVVYHLLRGKLQITQWVTWSDAFVTMGWVAVVGVVLTVVPTLVVTRKYLKV